MLRLSLYLSTVTLLLLVIIALIDGLISSKHLDPLSLFVILLGLGTIAYQTYRFRRRASTAVFSVRNYIALFVGAIGGFLLFLLVTLVLLVFSRHLGLFLGIWLSLVDVNLLVVGILSVLYYFSILRSEEALRRSRQSSSTPQYPQPHGQRGLQPPSPSAYSSDEEPQQKPYPPPL